MNQKENMTAGPIRFLIEQHPKETTVFELNKVALETGNDCVAIWLPLTTWLPDTMPNINSKGRYCRSCEVKHTQGMESDVA